MLTDVNSREWLSYRLCCVYLTTWAITMIHALLPSAQGCLRSNNENGLPPFRDYSNLGSNNTDAILHLHQAIIPSYRFDCCGNITQWGVDLLSNSDSDQFSYFLDLQVWRPSPTVKKSGCYSKVGSNDFTSMSQDSGMTIVTPVPQERIQFQPGDVLGFYMGSSRTGGDTKGVVLLQDFNTTGDQGYETEEVWYASTENLVIANRNCPFAVGSEGQLNTFTRAAPVISVSIYTMECSQLMLSSTPTMTPPPSLLTTPNSASNGNNSSLRIIIGAATAAAVLVAIIVSSTAIFGAVVCVKVRKYCSNEDLRMATNEAYGVQVQGVTRYRESIFYDYPTMQ